MTTTITYESYDPNASLRDQCSGRRERRLMRRLRKRADNIPYHRSLHQLLGILRNASDETEPNVIFPEGVYDPEETPLFWNLSTIEDSDAEDTDNSSGGDVEDDANGERRLCPLRSYPFDEVESHHLELMALAVEPTEALQRKLLNATTKVEELTKSLAAARRRLTALAPLMQKEMNIHCL